MKRHALIAALFVATAAQAQQFQICNVTTRGPVCHTIPQLPAGWNSKPSGSTVTTPPPATTPATTPVICEIRLAYNSWEPDRVAVTQAVSTDCDEARARAAISSKLNDLLLGEMLPR